MTVLRSGAASDVGRVRTVNEDLLLETPTLFAVADGMGGHAGGEVASRVAIDVLKRGFVRQPTVSGLIDAVRGANQSVWEHSITDLALRGMGTTLTAAALVLTAEGDRLVIANVGDSRTYCLQHGTLTQLTRDHSLAEELVDRGELTVEEAAVHPHRHILTRALGVAPEVDIDVWELPPQAGQRFLLCSDGLTNEVPERRIADVLTAAGDPQEAADSLVQLANENGGSDNITAVVIDVVLGDGTPKPVSTAPAVSATPVPTDRPPPPLPPPPTLLSRSGAEAVSGVLAFRSRAADLSARLSPRRITFRVVLFILLLAAIVAGGWGVARWYVDSSYFVQLKDGQVQIFQGRLGGFLGQRPHVVVRTGIAADEVPQTYLEHLETGVEEPSLSEARKYVENLKGLIAPSTTTTTVPSTSTSVVGGG